ncbi:GntR family transcriptional regulator [Streptomyces sp. NBC_01716]|uniref:GntR family transcriptional regulator n=1 Tax=Streptomyces sp. NBC_01716 TaxID=2975917 RepID=UPI002E2FA9F8|nr:GntR family transcriptional regulator [Streptomyces sp. NBC_01716]
MAANRTPGDAADPRPVHERIATDLRRAILSGDLPAGEPIPSTEKLKERFRASSASIQKAVTMLKGEGLLEGRAGSSVRVLAVRRQTMTPAAYSKPAEDGQPYRWLSEAEKKGRRPGIQLLQVGEVEPPADVREALGLEAKQTAVLRKQLLSLSGEPCELVHSYYPLELASGTALADKVKIKGGTPTLLASLGYPPLHTVDQVTAEEATNEEYEALRLPRQVAILRTFRVVLSTDDAVIEVTTMAKAGHLYSLQYDF